MFWHGFFKQTCQNAWSLPGVKSPPQDFNYYVNLFSAILKEKVAGYIYKKNVFFRLTNAYDPKYILRRHFIVIYRIRVFSERKRNSLTKLRKIIFIDKLGKSARYLISTIISERNLLALINNRFIREHWWIRKES